MDGKSHEIFEALLWKAISRVGLPGPVQSWLGNEVLTLVASYYVPAPSTPKTAVKSQTPPKRKQAPHQGSYVHLFVLTTSERSRCGHVERGRLPPERVTDDPSQVSCTHCIKLHLADSPDLTGESTCTTL